MADRGFPSKKLNGLTLSLTEILPLLKTSWGDLADQFKAAVTNRNTASLDKVMESIGTAYVLICAIARDLVNFSKTTTSKINSLEARISELERR